MSATIEKSILLNPTTIKAYRSPFLPNFVTLYAEGREDGICNIHWTELPIPIFPSVFAVVGQRCAAIGDFPYQTSHSFPYPDSESKVIVQTPDGEKTIPIEALPEDENTSQLKEIQSLLTSNTVMGMAPFSSDYQTAFQNAVDQLYKKFPGHINAQVIRSGFVAAGSPIGIAYTYVVMEQLG